jgi:hypothetical protein
MDAATIATTAASLIASKLAETVAGKTGDSLWAGITRIYDTVRAHLSGDPDAQEVLNRLEAKPASGARIAEVAEVLQVRLEGEPEFAQELAWLIEQAQSDTQTASFVTTVRDNAQVGRVTNVGSVGGDVRL